MIKGWRECKLGDVAEIKTGKSNAQDSILGGIYPLFDRSQSIKQSNRFLFDDEAIIVAGEGKVFTPRYFNGKFDLHQRVYAIHKITKAIPKFIFYAIWSNKKYFESVAVGSTVMSLRLNHFTDFPLLLPPLQEQKAIAEILSSLDDKIDLLHRQNQTLESIAQTLFRQWFIQDAKPEWEEMRLGDYLDCITGYSYKSDDLNESKNALVTLKNFARDGSFRLDGFKEFTGTKYKDSQIVKHGDLVVSHTDITQDADIIGNPALVVDMGKYDNLIITMDLMKVESKVDWLSKEFLYYLFKTEDFKFHCLASSNGTTVLHMNRKTIPEYRFKIPNIERIARFTNNIKEILQKQYSNMLQIQTLENLRDTLLPKLISGELRV